MIDGRVIENIKSDIDILSNRKFDVDSKIPWENIAERLESLLNDFQKYTATFKFFNSDFNLEYTLQELEKDLVFFRYKAGKVSRRDAREACDHTDNFGFDRHPRHRMKRAVELAEWINEVICSGRDLLEYQVSKLHERVQKLEGEQGGHQCCRYCGRKVEYTLVDECGNEVDKTCAHCYAVEQKRVNGDVTFRMN